MESKIDTKVTLYDAENKRMGETFSRRARQLVKQQRANWTDETHTAIRFLPDAAEEWEAETETPEAPASMDKNLYALATKRINTRRKMFWHTLGLIPGYMFFAVAANGWMRYGFDRGLFVGVMFTLWTLSYIYTVRQFIKHNKGFFPLAEMENRRARKLLDEVERLKRMGYGE